MILQKTINRDEFYETYFKLLNPIFNLTNLEINILSEFLKLYQDFKNIEEVNKLVFSSASRQLVSDRLNISKYNLNNYIKSLRQKNMIIDTGNGEYIFNPYLKVIPEDDFDITFKIKLK